MATPNPAGYQPKPKKQQPTVRGYNPYTDNGGTSLAIAGDDYCIIAGDTRQSEGYSINTRYAPKVYKLNEKSVLATGGMHADGCALVSRIRQNLEWYYYKHDKKMNIVAIAQLLQVMLYGKRFSPYFVWNTLGGIDDEGKGCVFSYDPVGNYERHQFNCGGSASHLIQPFLDNQIGRHHINDGKKLTIEECKGIVKDAFTSATERDIYTGDYLEIFIVTKDGCTMEKFELKKD